MKNLYTKYFFCIFTLSTGITYADQKRSYIVTFADSSTNKNELISRVFREISEEQFLDNPVFIDDYKKTNCYSRVINACQFNLKQNQREKLHKSKIIKHITPDYQSSKLLDVSVPLIGATNLSNTTGANGNGVSIAVLDTGIDYNHPAFGDCSSTSNPTCRIIAGYDFINNDSDPSDDHGHGTHVAGIVSGNGEASPGNSFVGIAPESSLLIYKVLDHNGSGNLSQLLMALEYVIDPNQDNDFSDKADIVNLSLGFDGIVEIPPLDEALNNVFDMGVLVIASAGNSGPSKFTVNMPASNKSTLAVGASTHLINSLDTGFQDYLAPYSSIGGVEGPYHGERLKPEIMAPGGDIHLGQFGYYASGIGSSLSSVISFGSGLYENPINNDYARLSGTSMAAPHVAGAAALLIELFPGASPKEIKSRMMLGATDLGLSPIEQGSGRLQIDNAAYFPAITEPSIIDFGNSVTPVSKPLTIKNISTSQITVQLQNTGPENFIFSPSDTFALMPNEEQVITINFTNNNINDYLELKYGTIDLNIGSFEGKVPFSYYVSPSVLSSIGPFKNTPGDVISLIEEEFGVYNIIQTDVDADGDNDFVVAVIDSVDLYVNEGGAFDKKRIYSTGWTGPSRDLPEYMIYDIDKGDFDGDGKDDIMVLSESITETERISLTLLENKYLQTPLLQNLSLNFSSTVSLQNGDQFKLKSLHPNGFTGFEIIKETPDPNLFDAIYTANSVYENDVIYLADYEITVNSINAQNVDFTIVKNRFNAKTINDYPNITRSIEVIDANNDSYLDVVLDSSTIYPTPDSYFLAATLLVNDGNSMFTQEIPLFYTSYNDPIYGTSFHLSNTKLVDLTGDGLLDIVGIVEERFNGEPFPDFFALTYFKNNGNFTFSSTPNLLVRRGEHLDQFLKYNHRFNGNFIIDDFDSDGMNELVISDASGQVEFFEFQGSQVVSKGIIFDFGKGTSSKDASGAKSDHHIPMTALDWNQDGMKDLLLVSQHNTEEFSSTHVLLSVPDLIFQDGFDSENQPF